MRIVILTALFLFSSVAIASDNYCKEETNGKFEKYPGFNVNFCFASAEFMKMFALRLYDERIPFVVYENGYIGYRTEDKTRINKIGDELIAKYMERKRN